MSTSLAPFLRREKQLLTIDGAPVASTRRLMPTPSILRMCCGIQNSKWRIMAETLPVSSITRACKFSLKESKNIQS